MRKIVIVNNPQDWDFNIDDVEVVAAQAYLTDPAYTEIKNARIFNLCRSYKYQSTGYYVSLLAEARGHRAIPNVTTIQDLKSQTIVRSITNELDELIQKSLHDIKSRVFTLSIYFGQNVAMKYEKLAKQLHDLFQAPLLRAEFVFNKEWILHNISPIPLNEVPENHRKYLKDFATAYFARHRFPGTKPKTKCYDLAILTNPLESDPPSNRKAIQQFIEAGQSLGFSCELITKDDYKRLSEFDALFIRETTSVNHHTYRFARRAHAEGLVVIDDPVSILRCTNKVYLAELLTKTKVPIPKTMIIHKENRDQVVQELGLPVVLKRPDSSFSQGVVKVSDEASLHKELDNMLELSDLVIGQVFMPTDFDWRIGILDKQPLYACKYYMAKDHWQIYNWDGKKSEVSGNAETVPIGEVPFQVMHTALKAANLIGDGLYGVDLKEIDGQAYVIEVNDNPSIDYGYEDQLLKKDLYLAIMKSIKEESKFKRISRMSSPRKPLHLFEAFGVEMEYMIVKNDTLEILPITDKVIYDVTGNFDSDVEVDDMAWSNELVLHVIELKTNGPAKTLSDLPQKFQAQVEQINRLLEKYNAKLLGSGAHPFMDPYKEMCLWPHDYNQIYEAYNKIFDCRGHGWANLQSTHLNLPFANDEEFGKLHAAIRVLLPVIPALSASSPILDNQVSGFADTRLEVYQQNQKQIPSIAGKVIPEQVFSQADYESKIFHKIYADIAPYDEEEILRDQFLNSRGAIARFDRGAIEIRIIDIQECPLADIAVLSAVIETLRALVSEKWTVLEEQKKWHENDLAEILWNVVKHGQNAVIANAEYLKLFGLQTASCTAQELWKHIYNTVLETAIQAEEIRNALTFILQNDTLSARIVKALGGNTSPENIKKVYEKLAVCLKDEKQFLA